MLTPAQALCLVAVFSTANATIYRYQDESGHWAYQDTPADDAERIELRPESSGQSNERPQATQPLPAVPHTDSPPPLLKPESKNAVLITIVSPTAGQKIQSPNGLIHYELSFSENIHSLQPHYDLAACLNNDCETVAFAPTGQIGPVAPGEYTLHFLLKAKSQHYMDSQSASISVQLHRQSIFNPSQPFGPRAPRLPKPPSAPKAP